MKKKQLFEDTLEQKRARLSEILASFNDLAVALSGGVDSGLLLNEAQAVLGKRVMAITVQSPIHPARELEDASRLAGRLGVTHLVLDTNEMDDSDFLANSPQRCYICKKMIFGQILEAMHAHGYANLAHGANADDAGDYRPGLKAAEELGVLAPLMDAGLTKVEIRAIAKARGLSVWDKPSMACLATRFPYGTALDRAAIEQVRHAEDALSVAGMRSCRVRHHGDIARIEMPLNQLGMLLADPLRRQIVDQFKALGFLHVSVDLEGYVSGSLNRALSRNKTSDHFGLEGDVDD